MQLQPRSLTFITIRSLGACARKQLIGIGRVPAISFANRCGNSILICRLSMVCRLVHWTRTMLECSNPSVSNFPILPPEDTGKASGTQNLCPCHPGGDSKQIPITLPTPEFTRRWSMHVLPKGYTKTRRYGGWSNPRREAYLEQCSKQLDAIEAPLSPQACEFDPFADPANDTDDACESCPACGGKMILQRQRKKPRWHEIMTSASRPSWYLAPDSG